MSAPSDRLRAGLAIAAAALGASLAVSQLSGGPPPVAVQRSLHGRHVRLGWPDSGPPSGVQCVHLIVRASEAAQRTYELPGDAGAQYVPLVQCASDADGGMEDALAALADAGVEVLPGSEQVVPWDGGQPQLEAWAPGTQEPPPSMCACSSGVGCSHVLEDGGTEPAPMGWTMRPGQFTGAGCVARACGTKSGQDLWPAACLPDGGL